MVGFKLGSNTVDAVKLGSTDVSKVYLGGTQIFPSSVADFPPVAADFEWSFRTNKYTDAGTTLAEDTDAVYRWNEQIANNHANQATASARATLIDDGSGPNSKAFLSGDGGDKYDSANNLGITGDASLDVLLVIKHDADDANACFALGTATGIGHTMIIQIGDTAYGTGTTANTVDVNFLGSVWRRFGTISKEWHAIYLSLVAGGSGADGVSAWIDGVSVAPTATGGGTNSINIQAAPVQLMYAFSQIFNGDMAGCYIWNGNNSEADRNSILTWANAAYGVGA